MTEQEIKLQISLGTLNLEHLQLDDIATINSLELLNILKEKIGILFDPFKSPSITRHALTLLNAVATRALKIDPNIIKKLYHDGKRT